MANIKTSDLTNCTWIVGTINSTPRGIAIPTSTSASFTYRESYDILARMGNHVLVALEFKVTSNSVELIGYTNKGYVTNSTETADSLTISVNNVLRILSGKDRMNPLLTAWLENNGTLTKEVRDNYAQAYDKEGSTWKQYPGVRLTENNWIKCASEEDSLLATGLTYSISNGTALFLGATENFITALTNNKVSTLRVPEEVYDSTTESYVPVTTMGGISELTANQKNKITNLIIGKNITSIASNSFADHARLKHLIFPDNVTSIGSSAFKNCSNLIEAKLSKSLGSISQSAFEGCSNLKYMSIPKSVTSIGKYAFHSCSGLMGITIGSGVTSIEDSAFYKCSRLTNITVPDNVTSISANAFQYCNGLTSITLPFVGASRIASKGYDQVFGYIFGYTTTSGSGTLQYEDQSTAYYYYIPSSLKEVTLTNSNNLKISDYAFNNCSGLTSITTPLYVASVGKFAFKECLGITQFRFPSPKADPDRNIKEGTFLGCRNLKVIWIPDTITSIGPAAFSGCAALTTINFEGTSSQWNNITKGDDWNYEVPSNCAINYGVTSSNWNQTANN